MPISKPRNKILQLKPNIGNNTSLQDVREKSFLLKNFDDKKFFFKRKVFIDGINGLEFSKLEKMLIKLKAEVLESYDEALDYVIVSKNQITGLNSTNKNSDLSNNKSNGNHLTLDSKLTRSRQIQKLLNSSTGKNNDKPISNDQSHFITHLQKNNVPILCVTDVWKWITAHYAKFIQNVEIVKENKILDTAKGLRVISDPGFKISHELDMYAPIYKANCKYMPNYWEEECSISSGKNSATEKTIEKSQTKFPLEVTKKCRNSIHLLKPLGENVKLEKKKVEAAKLYCECCRISFTDTVKHLQTPIHLKFSEDPLNFQGFGEDFNINSHLKEFLSTRIRKQKAIERIESRKLIKKLSVNDFKTETVNVPNHSVPQIIENPHNQNEQLINENDSIFKELDGIESIVKIVKIDTEKNLNEIEVKDEGNKNKATGNLIGENETVSNGMEGVESVGKEEQVVKIVLERNENNIESINKATENVITENEDVVMKLDGIGSIVKQTEIDTEINLNAVEVISEDNINKATGSLNNEHEAVLMEHEEIQSIEKQEKIVKIVLERNENNIDDANSYKRKTRNNSGWERISNESIKSISKKRSKLSLKLRRKPHVATTGELLYESCENLDPDNACAVATESEMKYEYCFGKSTIQICYSSMVITNYRCEPGPEELQAIEAVKENQTISRDNSYNIVNFDQVLMKLQNFFVPLDVLSTVLGQCDKMTIPNFVELIPISVTKLSRAVMTTILQSELSSLSSDICYFQKVKEDNALVSINRHPEVGIASVATFTRTISNDSTEIIKIPIDNQNCSNSDESSLELPSACRYNITLHSTPESVKTPLSPTYINSKNVAFSPFILRLAKKSCAKAGRCSPDIDVSPLRYGHIDSSFFKFDTVSAQETGPDPILNLKKIIVNSNSPCRFDVLSPGNRNVNHSKSKPFFSVDSLVENHFLEKFDMKLKSDSGKFINVLANENNNNKQQRKPLKRSRPGNGFNSSSFGNSDGGDYDTFIETSSAPKRRRRKSSKISNDIISESPLSHRPFRRAKYIARESINISTNLYLN